MCARRPEIFPGHMFVRPVRLLTTSLIVAVDYKWSSFQNRHSQFLTEDGEPQYVSTVHYRGAKRIYNMCKDNGGVYIKAAQFVAARKVLPWQYTQQLALLQDQAPAQPFSQVRRTLDDAFRREGGVDKVFSHIDANPVASASLAQVHLAILPDGKQAAIKVQRAGLRRNLRADLALIDVAAGATELLFPALKIRWLAKEFRDGIWEEVDFRKEGHSLEIAREMFKAEPQIRVPAVHWSHTTSRVLTMEAVSGIRVDDREGLEAAKLNPREVGDLVADAFAQMLFKFGHVHTDLHPGNLLVEVLPRELARCHRSHKTLAGALDTLRGGHHPLPRLIVLDHGSYARMSDSLRRDYNALWSALLLRGGPRDEMEACCRRMGSGDACRYPVVLFQGDSAAQWLALSSMAEVEREALESRVKQLKAEDRLNSEYLRLMAALPREWVGLTKAHSLVCSLHNDLWRDRTRAGRHRMHIFKRYAATVVPP